MDTPLGTLYVAERDGLVCRVSFEPGGLGWPERLLEATERTPLLADACAQLDEYFRGARREFSLPLEYSGTPFQNQVWRALCDIPYGDTLSYSALAARVATPSHGRAVGQACGANEILILRPCHRVLGGGGRLTGFGAGIPRKAALLQLEREAAGGAGGPGDGEAGAGLQPPALGALYSPPGRGGANAGRRGPGEGPGLPGPAHPSPAAGPAPPPGPPAARGAPGARTKMSILRDKFANKDTAFTDAEREEHGLVGRLPFRVETAAQQVARCRAQLDRLGTDLEKWMYLTRLQESNATLFYHLCMSDLPKFLPLVYTPTVGAACTSYSDIWQGLPTGFYLRREFAGRVREILATWPETPEVIVATDGTRILGLGDLGTGGHQICVGKLTLYSLGGGFDPRKTLPISFDFGAAVDSIREGPHYLGKPEPRDKRGLPELVAETVAAVRSLWPRCVFQFEDFSNDTAFSLLEANRHKGPIFNDDVQGTGVIAAATVAAGIRASNLRHSEKKTPADQVYVLYGAGAGGIGVAESICMLSVAEGKTLEQARAQFYVMDSKGLITSDREDFLAGKLQPHKLAFVRRDVGIEGHRTLEEVVRAVKPTCIIGMSITPGAFSPAVLEAISADPAVTPIILALSNPTAKCECTSQQAYDACRGNCFYASGSPMPEVHYGGASYTTAQCNNFYVFPGIGMGAYIAQVSEITDEMFAAVARGVADSVPEEALARGYLLPRLEDIREISVNCALNVCRVAQRQGKCGASLPEGDEELRALIRAHQWKGDY